MTDIAICAKCGKQRELCNSIRSEGIKQPRYCKDCLFKHLTAGDNSVDDRFWILQMIQLKDTESLEKLAEAQMEQMPCLPGNFTVLGLSSYISAAPRSRHIGGVNTAYLDGHIELLSNDIDPFLMANLVSINDSQVAP